MFAIITEMRGAEKKKTQRHSGCRGNSTSLPLSTVKKATQASVAHSAVRRGPRPFR